MLADASMEAPAPESMKFYGVTAAGQNRAYWAQTGVFTITRTKTDRQSVSTPTNLTTVRKDGLLKNML